MVSWAVNKPQEGNRLTLGALRSPLDRDCSTHPTTTTLPLSLAQVCPLMVSERTSCPPRQDVFFTFFVSALKNCPFLGGGVFRERESTELRCLPCMWSNRHLIPAPPPAPLGVTPEHHQVGPQSRTIATIGDLAGLASDPVCDLGCCYGPGQRGDVGMGGRWGSSSVRDCLSHLPTPLGTSLA